jgi:hypothetical protein
MHVDVLIQTYHTKIHMFKVYDRFYKDSYKQRQISLKDLRGIGGTANTLRCEISITNEGPLGYWRHRQSPLGMKIEINMRGPWGIGGTANTP